MVHPTSFNEPLNEPVNEPVNEPHHQDIIPNMNGDGNHRQKADRVKLIDFDRSILHPNLLRSISLNPDSVSQSPLVLLDHEMMTLTEDEQAHYETEPLIHSGGLRM